MTTKNKPFNDLRMYTGIKETHVGAKMERIQS